MGSCSLSSVTASYRTIQAAAQDDFLVLRGVYRLLILEGMQVTIMQRSCVWPFQPVPLTF